MKVWQTDIALTGSFYTILDMDCKGFLRIFCPSGGKLKNFWKNLSLCDKATEMTGRKAVVDRRLCVACGTCVKVCPKEAIAVRKGLYAEVSLQQCVGCGLCARACPADIIQIREVAAG